MPIVIIFTNSARAFVAYFPDRFDLDLFLLPIVVFCRLLLRFKPLALASPATSTARTTAAQPVRTLATR